MMIGKMTCRTPKRMRDHASQKETLSSKGAQEYKDRRSKWATFYFRILRRLMGNLTARQSPTLTARASSYEDCIYLAPYLRRADKQEIEANGFTDPLNALLFSYANSTHCYTILTPDGQPCGMFGVGPKPDDRGVGIAWLMGTDDIVRYKRSFIRQSAHWVKEFQMYYPVLWNYVDARNVLHVRWLKWLGANFLGETRKSPDGPVFLEFMLI